MVCTGSSPANSSPGPTCQTLGQERIQVKTVGCSNHSHVLMPLSSANPCSAPAGPATSGWPWALGSGSRGSWTSSLVCPDPPGPSNRQPPLCPYLEGLQEPPVAPVLKLVLFRAESQHGLCVGMELIVKVVQEGGPRPVLGGRRVEIVERALRAEGAPDAWLRAALRAKCISVTVWTSGQAGLHAHKCRN